jgi:hypothetical protein
MRAFLDSQRDWLTVERLPAYAPELNAVEYLWANLKDVELANLPTTSLAEVADATEQGIQRICKSDRLVVGFLAHTGLSLDPMNRQPNPRNSKQRMPTLGRPSPGRQAPDQPRYRQPNPHMPINCGTRERRLGRGACRLWSRPARRASGIGPRGEKPSSWGS